MAVKISNTLVPRYSKFDLEAVATEFLTEFYLQALEEPVPVPIRDIARKKLGLKVLERHLTEDLSVYGQMCFTNGVAEIYDPENEEYKEIRVRWGTMIIDPDTLTKRNIGCMNNTIAHETVHWWKHRDYHILQSVIDKRLSKVYKCPTAELDEGKQEVWTDEEWMEWQAVNLAPRILMPFQTFTVLAERFMDEYSVFPVTMIPQRHWVVQRLSDFYLVSKQSAAIRLSELEIL